MRSKIMGIIGILLLVVIVSGCTSPANNTTSNQGQGYSTPTSTQSSGGSNVVVKVSYNGPWSGNIGDSSGSKSVDGTGNKDYPLSSNPGIVSVVFQKKDNSTNPLTVQILSGGSVVKSQSTNAEYGTVSLSNSF